MPDEQEPTRVPPPPGSFSAMIAERQILQCAILILKEHGEKAFPQCERERIAGGGRR
jgi:hypothetical protein